VYLLTVINILINLTTAKRKTGEKNELISNETPRNCQRFIVYSIDHVKTFIEFLLFRIGKTTTKTTHTSVQLFNFSPRLFQVTQHVATIHPLFQQVPLTIVALFPNTPHILQDCAAYDTDPIVT
jgi:hypothetical protein